MDKNYRIGFVLIFLLFKVVTATNPSYDSENNVSVTAIEGENTTLPCTLPNLTDTSQVNWTDPDGVQLTNGKRVLNPNSRFSLQSDWELHINNVDLSDNGTFVCEINTMPPQQKEAVLTVLPSSTFNLVAQSESPTNEPTTEDPNQCSDSRPCENGGICESGVCNCSTFHKGNFCEIPTVCPFGHCNVNNTKNCTVTEKGGSYTYKCDCETFYKGDRCEIYDLCLNRPCENKGYCRLLFPQNGYTCMCRTGDPNNDCKLNVPSDNCGAPHPPASAEAYITCIDKIDSYKMYCSPGYTGEEIGCKTTQDPQMFCNNRGLGFCKDEGFCKPLCNVDVCNGTKNCEFTVNPYNTTGFDTKKSCIRDFGDGYDYMDCHGEDTLFDGFDKKINNLTDCSPFIDTICTRDFGNGDCKPECNNADCLFDGFDCQPDNRTELAGVVIVELKGQLEALLNDVQKNVSMMLRSGVNLTVETYKNETVTLLQLKVTDTEFTDIEYAGKFLAAAVAKRPEWLEGVKITDIYVCPAGKYSRVYSDKCQSSCDTCDPTGDICDWKTGECDMCPAAHWGPHCVPCDTCVQQGDVCETFMGECIFGCKARHYGDQCLPCAITCKKEGDVCNNNTGECLHGCLNDSFYGSTCRQCPQNCVGGCNKLGHCNECLTGWFGETCKKSCNSRCQNDTCDMRTGFCTCELGTYWHEQKNVCEECSHWCTSECDVISGACNCKGGYHGIRCDSECKDTCLTRTCFVNGTCDRGCKVGFYGPMCIAVCPTACTKCSRDDGACGGNCKPGFEGSNCEKTSDKSAYVDDTTDNTGVIIGVVISLLLVVLILVVACCYWRRRQSGDYVMEDEEMEPEPLTKKSNNIEVHNNMHMQPTSPLLGHSMDMIELDEKQHTVVYAGPGRGQAADNVPNVNVNNDSADNVPTEMGPETDKDEDDVTADEADGTDKPEVKKNERCTSSVTMEIGMGGRVLSVSDADEVPSPTLNKDVGSAIGEEESAEAAEDDSAFDEPPHSPLGEVRAPLASEENILASLGPKEIQFGEEDEPAALEQDSKEAEKESKKSRSGSSSSSSSSSSKSSKGSNKEITTEM